MSTQPEQNRAIDALVAEKVIGWRWFKVVTSAVLIPPWYVEEARQHKALYTELPDGPGKLEREYLDGRRFMDSGRNNVNWMWPEFPRYSTTWGGMGLVVEGMAARGWFLGHLSRQTRGKMFQEPQDYLKWYCQLRHGRHMADEYGETAPLAVALAALGALGVEVTNDANG